MIPEKYRKSFGLLQEAVKRGELILIYATNKNEVPATLIALTAAREDDSVSVVPIAVMHTPEFFYDNYEIPGMIREFPKPNPEVQSDDVA